MCVSAKSVSSARFLATPWTIVHQAPLSMGILQARILEWIPMSSSRGSSQPRDQIQVSLIAGRLYHVSHRGSLLYLLAGDNLQFGVKQNKSKHKPISESWHSSIKLVA